MKVHHEILSTGIRRPVATIGSFDGVHRGHLRVIEALEETAALLEGESVVVTFDPHPREVLYPMERKPGILTTLEEKIARMEGKGVEHLVVMPFTRELGALGYAEFVERVLVETLGIKGLVVGYDHRFGKGREGDYEKLARAAARLGFVTRQVEALQRNETSVSSTKIRDALATGNVRLVNDLLGYRYPLTGTVVTGDRLGRRIGFPTANLQVGNERKCLPASGAYAVEASVDGSSTRGLLNVGTRPTVSTTGALSIEAHLLDFDREIYGKTLTVRLVERLRGERKFENVEELRMQLARDREEARACPGW